MRKQAAVRQADVLDVLHKHDKPMTAYAILDRMKVTEPDLAAPTIYRALAALTDQGRAHKLESIKAFVPCRCDHEAAVPVLAICGDCGTVEEHDGTGLLWVTEQVEDGSLPIQTGADAMLRPASRQLSDKLIMAAQ